MIKTIKKIVFTIAILLAPVNGISAQYLFKTLNSKDGLSNSQINCIHKDNRGFMWFGTPGGLYRFDGYTFKNFQSNSQDGTSLPDSYIKNISETADGRLWIETSSGLCIYSPQSESFERDMNQFFSKIGIDNLPSLTYIDSKNTLWAYIEKKGVVAYNMQQQLIYEFDFTRIPEGNICSFSECQDGIIIVYDNGRLACCNIDNQQQTVWVANDLANKKTTKTNTLKAFTDQMENIWIYGKGTLVIYNKKTGVWDMNIGNTIGMNGLGTDNSINDIDGDRTGNIWIATDRSGLLRTKVNSKTFENVSLMNNARVKTNVQCIQSVYVDNTDLVWIGTEKSGVAYYGNDIYKFQSLINGDITAITEDSNGHIWYGTNNNGVIGYNGQLASNKVTSMTSTPDGSIWVGSKQNGLTRIKGNESIIYSVAKDSSRTIINDNIKDLCTDKTGRVWIATSGGLQVYNQQLNTFSTYTKENKKLSTNNITTLFYGKGNNLYIGTGEGLIVMNLSSNSQTILTGNRANIKKFTNNYITQVFEDSRGLIWAGTREGLNVLNISNDELNHITRKEGLCDNNINGITEDNNNNIWITTSNGICRIVVQRNHEDGTFNYGLYNYSTSDGLQSNEYNPGAIIKKKDGNVIFGGLFGIDWIRTNTKLGKESLPKVMLTQLYVNEEEIITGHDYNGNTILPIALNEIDAIKLNNNQNTITIKFAAGNYNQCERLQFMYWLEGYQTKWHNGDALTHGVTFSDLPSGEYILHVKAISADGSVSDKERFLTIKILPPWWQTWWMYIVYTIIIIIFVYLWRFGFNKIAYLWAKKKAIITELRKQREEIKSASDDLRQPMSRMASIISSMSERDRSVEEKEMLNSIHFQMLQIITRLSEMQMSLDNPESIAKENAANRLQLNDKGVICLSDSGSEELTVDQRNWNTSIQYKKYTILVIDDNEEFMNYLVSHLNCIYDVHGYCSTTAAMQDLEVLDTSLIICKQDMPKLTGSDLCNRLKTSARYEKIKFVLMTDVNLSIQEMQSMSITLAADDYLAKPFNIQEAIIRFNKLLGIDSYEINSNSIEGKETRMLERRNASMTTATITYGNSNLIESNQDEDSTPDDSMGLQISQQSPISIYDNGQYIEEYSMNDARDRNLMLNIEQYVIHNMSRGQLNLEDMATAMGMGRVPFFHMVRNITGKTPAALVKELRLKHACILLEKTDLNLSELANQVGLLTAENFISIFKERYKISPLEYRMKYRKI